MAAGEFTVVIDADQVVGGEPASGRLTVRFQGGADHAVVADELKTLDEYARRGEQAMAVSAGYALTLPTDVAAEGDPETSTVGYDLTWFTGNARQPDARVTALFTGQPDGSTVNLSDLVSQEAIPTAASAGYAAQAEASAAEAAASAADAATFDPDNFVGKDTLVFRVDDHASVQAAIDAAEAAGGGDVWFTPGDTYVITDTLTVTDDNVRLIGNGATIDGSGIATGVSLSQQFAIKAFGTIGSTVAITSDLTAGTATVETTTATFAAGDIVQVTSDQNYTDGATGSYGNRGALHEVDSITDADTLVLTEPSFFTYASASSATLRKVTPLEGLVIDGLRIRMGGVMAVHNGILVDLARNPVVRNCDVAGADDTGIQVTRCWGFLAEDNKVTAQGNDPATGVGETGYGIVPVDACRNGVIRRNDLRKCRHGVAGGGSPVSILIRVEGNNVTDSLGAALECHEETFWWDFVDNIVTGGDGIGILIRGQGCTVRRNRISRCGAHGIQMRNGDVNTDGVIGAEITDNFISDTGGAGIRWEGTADCRNKGGYIAGNRLLRNALNNLFVQLSDDLTIGVNTYDTTVGGTTSDGNNIRIYGTAAATATRCERVSINGGTFRNGASRWLSVEYADRVTVTNPYVVNLGSQTQVLTGATNAEVFGLRGPAAPQQTDVIGNDSNRTLTPLVSQLETIHNGTITADRTLTLSTTNAFHGARFKVTRVGGGAFNISVGGLKNLATNQWCEVVYDEALSWRLVAFGSL